MKHLLKDEIDTDQKLANISLFIDEPDEYRYEWLQKLRSFISLEKKKLASLQAHVSNSNNKHAQRLGPYIQDKNSHLKSMQKLLTDILEFNEAEIKLDKLSFSPTQSFYSYNELIFRDWCWKSEDLSIYVDYCHSKILNQESDVLFLGAGACGLPFKVAQSHQKVQVHAIELNPYLIATAQRILEGKSIKLYDFPFSPKSSSDLSKKWELTPVKEVPTNLNLAIADFYHLPFQTKSFDSIVACWFYDILDDSLHDLLLHTKAYLKDGGSLVFIGPSNFHKNDIMDFRAQDEIREEFEACGFEVNYELKNIVYLDGDGHSTSRNEEVLFIHAKMIQPDYQIIEDKKFSLDPDQSIPDLPEIKYRSEQSHIFALILAQVDGKKSINDIANLLASDLGLSAEESADYINAFFNKLIWEIKSQ